MPNPTAANSPAPIIPGNTPANGALTIERMLAFDAGREYRLDPRQRWVAYTREACGARQLFLLPLRGGPVVQLSASEKSISDPAVGARRSSPGLRPRWRDLADRCRRFAPGRGDRASGGQQPAALEPGRAAPGLHLPPSGLVPGLADRCADSAPRPAGQQPPSGRAKCADAGRRRCRRLRLVA